MEGKHAQFAISLATGILPRFLKYIKIDDFLFLYFSDVSVDHDNMYSYSVINS